MKLLDMLRIATQYLLPKHAVSRLVGYLAAAEAGSLTTFLIKAFIKRFNINMSEAAQEDPAQYKTFNAFFTRKLKEGLLRTDRRVYTPCFAVLHPVACGCDGNHEEKDRWWQICRPEIDQRDLCLHPVIRGR